MPLRQTIYSGECPLDKFKIIPATKEIYNKDPIETCSNCEFGDTSQEIYDLDKICNCPLGMNRSEYNQLKDEYESTRGNPTKKGFQIFVKYNYKKLNCINLDFSRAPHFVPTHNYN